MIFLVIGGSKSGKSRIAEDLLSGCSRKIYLATMENNGDEAQAAISRHRKMREGKGFETIEKSHDIQEITLSENVGGILVECLSTLCANEIFSVNEKNPTEKIVDGIKKLAEKTQRLVIVSSTVNRDGIEYPEETANYIRILSELNARTAEISDSVIESVCGIPVTLKGAIV